MLSFSTHPFGVLCFVFFFPLDIENTGCTKFLDNFCPTHVSAFLKQMQFIDKRRAVSKWQSGNGVRGTTKDVQVWIKRSLSPVVLYHSIKLLLLQRKFKVPQTCFKIFIKYCTNIIPMAIAVLAHPGAVWMQHCRTNFRLHMNLDAPSSTNSTTLWWLHLYAVIY